MTVIKVRATREVPLALDGLSVRVFGKGEEFHAPEHVVRGQIGLGALEPADQPAPGERETRPAAYEGKPAAYETAVQRPRRARR